MLQFYWNTVILCLYLTYCYGVFSNTYIIAKFLEVSWHNFLGLHCTPLMPSCIDVFGKNSPLLISFLMPLWCCRQSSTVSDSKSVVWKAFHEYVYPWMLWLVRLEKSYCSSTHLKPGRKLIKVLIVQFNRLASVTVLLLRHKRIWKPTLN